jgi:TPR repeat protein
MKWLEMAAGAGNVEAYFALGEYLLRREHDPATRNRGFDWMKRAAEVGNLEARLYYASLLVSWPDATKRDAGLALKLMRELGEAFDYNPAAPEIRAAAHAALGEFPAALKQQKKAVSRAKQLKWDPGAQQERLKAYEKGQSADGELIGF